MRDPQLQILIEKALTAWPKLIYAGGRNSRAHAAADLVQHGKVRQIAGDCYDVDGHTCYATGDVCDCEDHAHGAPDHPKVGRLCKHRLAARMHRVWDGECNEVLLAAIRQVISLGDLTLVGHLAFAKLRFEWDYDTDRRWLIGYEAAGERVRWVAGDPSRVEFTWLQLRWALEQLGWGVERLPQKERWYEYSMAIKPGRGIALNEATMHTRGTTEAMVARHKASQDWIDSLARHGNQIGVGVNEQVAQRAQRRRVELAAA